MWPTIDRTRRRLRRDPRLAGSPLEEIVLVDGDGVAPTTTIVMTLGRPELDRLCAALVARAGVGALRPDTPAKLEDALDLLIVAVGGGEGTTRVLRRPAGLTAPEAWQVRFTDVHSAVVDAVHDAIRGGTRR